MDADCSAYLPVEQVVGRTSQSFYLLVPRTTFWSGDEVAHGIPEDFLLSGGFTPLDVIASGIYLQSLRCVVRHDGRRNERH